jgi:hypothetical protein
MTFRRYTLLLALMLGACSGQVWVDGMRERPGEGCLESLFELDARYWGRYSRDCTDDGPNRTAVGDDGSCYMFGFCGSNHPADRDPFFAGNDCPPDRPDCCAWFPEFDLLPYCEDALLVPPED